MPSLNCLRQLARLVGEIGRRADVAAAGCRACARGRCRRRSRPPPSARAAPAASTVAPTSGSDDVRERRRGRLLLRLQLVEAVERLAHAEHRVAHVPGQARGRRPRCRTRKSAASLAPSSFSALGRAAHRVAVRGLAELAALAQARPAARARRRRPAAARSSSVEPALSGEVAARARCAARRLRRLVGALARPRSARAPRAAPPSTRQPVFAVSGAQRLYAKFHCEVSHDWAASIA